MTPANVAFFHQNLSIQESTLKIRLGERLCEGTLLRGLLVHSSGDYAELLVQLTGMSQSQFVAMMNNDALTLGLSKTHYADFTGISPSDLSTAEDQTTLAVDLMTSEPVVDSIVALTKVKVPVAGEVGTYTPYLGSDGVVGVKSGYTLAAGGCVVMAINVTLGGIVVPTYEVVLSQQGPNALDVAGATHWPSEGPTNINDGRQRKRRTNSSVDRFFCRRCAHDDDHFNNNDHHNLLTVISMEVAKQECCAITPPAWHPMSLAT